MLRTYQPSKVKRNRKFGFRARMATRGGRLVLARRRAKGRAKLTISDEKNLTDFDKLGMEADLLLPGRFYRSERIKSSDEIRNLFKNGERVSVSGAKLFFLPNSLKINRIAFTLSRHYGSAVKRNRSKRYSREVYRSFKTYLNAGYDLLLLVYPGNDSFGMRYVQFSSLCDKAGLLKK